MDPRLMFLCLFLLIAKGVFGDEVESVSVMEGDSVTLHTDVIKEKDDKILWYYGPDNTFIARINGEASIRMLSDDERFRDKLKPNYETGDLTITHITTQHNGVYTLKMSRNNKVSYKKFDVTVGGVLNDEVKSVSVREGHPVILYTDTELQRGDVMVWSYGPENTFIARLNGEDSSTEFSDDERFIDRVRLDDSTGALMISDITTQHSGLYQLKISRNNRVSYKKFDVTVSGVFGDKVKSVSVRKGHSVILYTGDVKQSDDVMEWRFGPEKTLVARINGKTGRTRLSPDERFRGRLKRDDSTGDIMISDTKAHHSGLYHLRIKRDNKVSYKGFNVTVHYEVSVREGHSVILYTHVLKQRDDVIVWYYGPEHTIVAVVNGKTGTNRLSDDERFRDRVKLDDQTGDLLISDTRTNHSGLYQLRINSNNKVLYEKFDVTVHAHLPISQQNSLSSERSNNLIANQTQNHKTDACQPFSNFRVPWVWVIAVVLLINMCISVSVCVCKHRDPMKASHALKDDKSSINSSTTNVIYTGDEKKMLENLI